MSQIRTVYLHAPLANVMLKWTMILIEKSKLGGLFELEATLGKPLFLSKMGVLNGGRIRIELNATK